MILVYAKVLGYSYPHNYYGYSSSFSYHPFDNRYSPINYDIKSESKDEDTKVTHSKETSDPLSTASKIVTDTTSSVMQGIELLFKPFGQLFETASAMIGRFVHPNRKGNEESIPKTIEEPSFYETHRNKEINIYQFNIDDASVNKRHGLWLIEVFHHV
ncbi:hypothetical protein L596_005332 [Steinernema carpocapsae]|uniref:Uncharacterized protein n=2 Tax=Steinernema carpocapsae TaxID=34508 RepID=A0A4U8V2A8_STECR|nr:hypothetical protein L596_005332 [Steinernema carpocapsae]